MYFFSIIAFRSISLMNNNNNNNNCHYNCSQRSTNQSYSLWPFPYQNKVESSEITYLWTRYPMQQLFGLWTPYLQVQEIPTGIYVLGNIQPTSIPVAYLTLLPRANTTFTQPSNAVTAKIYTRQTSKNAQPTVAHSRK